VAGVTAVLASDTGTSGDVGRSVKMPFPSRTNRDDGSCLMLSAMRAFTVACGVFPSVVHAPLMRRRCVISP
jgi:hypothetical protein